MLKVFTVFSTHIRTCTLRNIFKFSWVDRTHFLREDCQCYYLLCRDDVSPIEVVAAQVGGGHDGKVEVDEGGGVAAEEILAAVGEEVAHLGLECADQTLVFNFKSYQILAILRHKYPVKIPPA